MPGTQSKCDLADRHSATKTGPASPGFCQELTCHQAAGSLRHFPRNNRGYQQAPGVFSLLFFSAGTRGSLAQACGLSHTLSSRLTGSPERAWPSHSTEEAGDRPILQLQDVPWEQVPPGRRGVSSRGAPFQSLPYTSSHPTRLPSTWQLSTHLQTSPHQLPRTLQSLLASVTSFLKPSPRSRRTLQMLWLHLERCH